MPVQAFPGKIICVNSEEPLHSLFTQSSKSLMSGFIRNRLPTHNEQIKSGRWKSYTASILPQMLSLSIKAKVKNQCVLYFITSVNQIYIKKPRAECVKINWIQSANITNNGSTSICCLGKFNCQWIWDLKSGTLIWTNCCSPTELTTNLTTDIPFSQGLQAAHSAQDELWILFVHVNLLVVWYQSIFPLM